MQHVAIFLYLSTKKEEVSPSSLLINSYSSSRFQTQYNNESLNFNLGIYGVNGVNSSKLWYDDSTTESAFKGGSYDLRKEVIA